MYASVRPPVHTVGNADPMNTGYMGMQLPTKRVTNPLNALHNGPSWTYAGNSRQELIWSKFAQPSAESRAIRASRSQPCALSMKARSRRHAAGKHSGNPFQQPGAATQSRTSMQHNGSNPEMRLQRFLESRYSKPNVTINPKFQIVKDINFHKRFVTPKNQLSLGVKDAPSWSFRKPEPINYRDVNKPPAGRTSTGSSKYLYMQQVRNNPHATTAPRRAAW